MRHDTQFLTQDVSSLAPGLQSLGAYDRLDLILSGAFGQVALVSSFGADSVVLLHMAAQIAPSTPVLFLDTGMHFAQTLTYQKSLAGDLGLRDIRVIRPDPEKLFARDPDGLLHFAAPDACCALRKTEPLEDALKPFDLWISGRKRFQSETRAALPIVERDKAGRIKLNPLADWDARDLSDYITRHALPRHPLSNSGYASIGCQPCSSATLPGEDPRTGRWRGRDKTECGIHFPTQAEPTR